MATLEARGMEDFSSKDRTQIVIYYINRGSSFILKSYASTERLLNEDVKAKLEELAELDNSLLYLVSATSFKYEDVANKDNDHEQVNNKGPSTNEDIQDNSYIFYKFYALSGFTSAKITYLEDYAILCRKHFHLPMDGYMTI
ncbi:hypothetical protein COEREDRAFT_87572 [Coemansia reversa NRRL 1564]|uniref:Uncharacterized protein n=1 Tax=Coemansia reversa (strain ATCC 12441 / NRRL 1564) TaxID=763665 RepID=A0A2G5B9Y0_COERN|nr:hypothetical protein COEREDRAFT_87572 [Coemansia reversa NRRL 1564]|eukprot:PIA15829.1 hypothetical protein COEREDRAFT_87572 [Coemansia reversa NRRL 1564]